MPVSIAVDPDGRPQASKIGPVERIAREAHALRTSSGPGVVALLEHSPGRLVTAWVAGGVMTDDASVELMCDLARVLRRLHALGLTHGRLTADHVLVDSHGAPVLCGFSEPGTPTDDIEGFGRLLSMGAIPVPARPGHRNSHIVNVRSEMYRLGRLLVENPAGWDAQQVVHHLEALMAPPPVPERRSVRPRVVVPALFGLIAVAVWMAPRPRPTMTTTAGLIPMDDTAPPPATSALPTSWTTPLIDRTTSAAPTSSLLTVPATPTTLVEPPPSTETCATGCVKAGPVTSISRDGQTFTLDSDPDDLMVLGDWDCDGTPTPALLRRPSGAVDQFDRWPTDVDITARRVGMHPGATGLWSVRAGTCDTLRVVLADGTSEVVDDEEVAA